MASDESRPAFAIRRQWGSDRRQLPLPAIPKRPSDRAVTVGRVAILVTVASWLCFVVFTIDREIIHNPGASFRTDGEATMYALLITLLTCSAVAYLLTRLGYFRRARTHRRTPRIAIDNFFERSAPTLMLLVPSYREETSVVRKTLLSAALQEYPSMTITLLIDDPPYPSEPEYKAMLDAMRMLPGEISELLSEPRFTLGAALEMFEARLGTEGAVGLAQVEELAMHHDYAADWINALADNQEIVDHSDSFFADHVLRALSQDITWRAAALRAAISHGAEIERGRLLQLSRRLAWTFRAELTSFERKRYRTLSDEPSKAMNLNSYIGLMGGSYRDVVVAEEWSELVSVDSGSADLVVPDPDFILNLDADSVLLPEYCERIIFLLEQSQNARVAVGQTPYSSYPGSATRIERIAGATTDVQHMLHQGLTYYDSTFWVGANAIVRKRALDEIVRTEFLGDLEVRRYISDRTVIEDTDASIDLGVGGWSLFNYPERLSYSSTPPDFGSLCVQRRRWANGGLLIVHKLRRQSRTRNANDERMRWAEWFLRLNYMASISWSTAGLVLLLTYPFNNRLLSIFPVFAALPYFVMMSSDLKTCGYKRLDVLRVYGFNLILMPVNLAGTLSSVWQWITGEKTAFGRTPKVVDRTRALWFFAFAPYFVIALSAYTLTRDYFGHRWGNAVYAAINLVLGSYAVIAFIGVPESLSDIWHGLIEYLYVPAKPPAHERTRVGRPFPDPPPIDWQTVLYNGPPDPSYKPQRPATPDAAQVHIEQEVRFAPPGVPAEAAARPEDGDGAEGELRIHL
jgi:cellulose synthase (UDP-forming)